MKIMFYLFSECYFILSPEWFLKVENEQERQQKYKQKTVFL